MTIYTDQVKILPGDSITLIVVVHFHSHKKLPVVKMDMHVCICFNFNTLDGICKAIFTSSNVEQ